MKILTTVIIVVTAVIMFLSGCTKTNADPYKDKYEYQLAVTDTLLQKIDELKTNYEEIKILSIHKIDSLKTVNGTLQLSINNLNSRIDSLQNYYANLVDAKTRLDSLTTFINNDMINFIKSLKIK